MIIIMKNMLNIQVYSNIKILTQHIKILLSQFSNLQQMLNLCHFIK